MHFKSVNHFPRTTDAVNSLLNNVVDLHAQTVDLHAQTVDHCRNPATIAGFWQARLEILPESGDIRSLSPDFNDTVPDFSQSGQNGRDLARFRPL
jgi:hypothetical protein